MYTIERYLMLIPMFRDSSWGLRFWLAWLGVVNTVCIFFLAEPFAQAVVFVWVYNLLFMNSLYIVNGYNRFLGLPHVICWTPLLVLTIEAIRTTDIATYKIWLWTLLITNGVSLVIDYVDVYRYLSGDRT